MLTQKRLPLVTKRGARLAGDVTSLRQVVSDALRPLAASKECGESFLLGPFLDVDRLSSFNGAQLLSSSELTCSRAFMSSLNFGPSWMCLELL